MKIIIIWVGKTKNSPIRHLAEDYLERLGHMVACQIVEIRDLSRGRGLRGTELAAAEGVEISKALSRVGRVVVLDETGCQFSSTGFAQWIEGEQNRGTRDIAFVIGGPDGVDRGIVAQAHLQMSLGKMTWTHEMCRVLLLEQIYRAFCILRNTPYHR